MRCHGRRSARGGCTPTTSSGARPVLTPTTLIGFATVIACTVAANLMLKLGADVPEAQRVFLGIFGWKSVAGLAVFGCGGIIYGVLLRRVPLNLAQVLAAA